MANGARNQQKSDREPLQHAGDDRRAGDTDGNASGGSSKSKGATNPADDPPAGRKESNTPE